MRLSSKIPKLVLYTSATGATYGVALLIKTWLGGPFFRDDIRADNKVVIITGSNTGIGKETAWELARRGAKVYMACRDIQKCEEARTEIVLDTKHKYMYCRECDLASFESVKKFVEQFSKDENKLDILINNAGVAMLPKQTKTKEGIEMQLGVNHMGHFLLTNLLLDKLKASAPSRIINVSSTAHYRGKITKKDLNSEKAYNKWDAYSQSKLANILFTKELAERLYDDKVTVNAIHPGVVDTELTRHLSFLNSWLAAIFIKPLVWPFIKSVKQGAQTSIYTALEPSLENVSGKYFSNSHIIEESKIAKDGTLAKWLWAVSEKWTRLNAENPQSN